MSEQKYEVVGQFTREQAQQIAELLGGGSVIWAYGHTYPCDGIVVRRAGCACPQCSAQETFACLGGCGASVPGPNAYCSACFLRERHASKETPPARAPDWCDDCPDLPETSTSADGSIAVTDLRGKTVKTPF